MSGQRPLSLIGTMPTDIDPEELNCSVCLDIYELPVELPCRHKLCLQCWRKILKSDSKCPECRYKVLDPSFVFVNEVLWNYIKTHHSEELLERKTDLSNVIQNRRFLKRDLLAEMASLRGPPDENRRKVEQEKRDKLLAWKILKMEQKEDRQRAKQVRLDRRLAKSLAREEKTRSKDDETHWQRNMEKLTSFEDSGDSDSSIEVVSGPYFAQPNVAKETLFGRPSTRTINVTSGVSGATVQYRSFPNSNVTAASSSSSQGRRLIWNTAAPEIYEGKESEVYSEAKRLGKNNHEFIGVTMSTSRAPGDSLRFSRAPSTVTSGAYEREMQEEMPQN